MQFAVLIVSPPGYIHSQSFQEIADLLHFGLLALGHQSIITTTIQPGCRHVVLGSNLLAQHPLPLPPDSIFYNLEQVSPDSTWINSPMLQLFQQFEVWDYSLKNIRFLTELGVSRIHHLPIGYVPELTRIQNLEVSQQDIDVLFYGSLNQRRLEVLEALELAGVKVEVAFGVYGAERDRLIAQAKIVLNLHFYAAQVLEMMRVAYLLANHKLVVSENSPGDPDQEALTGGLVFTSYDQIVQTCLQMLALPRKRQQIAAAGFELLRQRDQVEYLRNVVRSP